MANFFVYPKLKAPPFKAERIKDYYYYCLRARFR